MSEQKIEVVLDKQERLYSRNYHDFMDCQLLNGEEKIIYLSLKRFINVKLDNGQVYPTIETIQNMTGWGNKKVIKYIKSLVKKGVIQKKQNGLTKANLYTIKDSSEMWESENLEELKNVAEEENIIDFSKIPTELLEKELEKRKKRNEPETSPMPTKAKEETDSTLNANLQSDCTSNFADCQEEREKQEIKERYSLEFLKKYYEYETMVLDKKHSEKDIETVFDVLYENLNTTKKTIRVNSQEKPTEVVISKLMKLTCLEIFYAIDQYKKQTNIIDNPKSYLLTLLYNAETQQNLEIINRVNHDMVQVQQNPNPTEIEEQKEQAIEEYNNYSEEEKNEIRNKYIEIMFNKKGAISELEKEWSKPPQEVIKE